MATELEVLGEKNKVFMHPKGYIEVLTTGVQNPETVKSMGDQVADLAITLRTNHQPVLVLDNLTNMSLKQPGSVPKAVAAEARRLDFDKVAMLGGANRLLKYGTNFMIKAIGKGHTIRYFTNRAEAETWLLGG